MVFLARFGGKGGGPNGVLVGVEENSTRVIIAGTSIRFESEYVRPSERCCYSLDKFL